MSNGNPKHEIPIDSAKPFTLFEHCPSCKGTGAGTLAGLIDPTESLGPCKWCKGEGGRQRPFDTLEALQLYASNLSPWPKPAR